MTRTVVPDCSTVQEPARVTPSGPVRTLAEQIRRTATERADHPALVWQDGSLTWAQFDAAVDRVAAALAQRLPAPSDGHPARVAIALPTSADFAVTFFGVLRAGLVAVPVNPGVTGPELRHVLADSGAAALVCTERVAGLLADLRAGLPELVEVHTSPPSPTGPAAPPATCDRDDLAVLLYTSGTEGHPKGAMLTHGALLANHEQVDRIRPAVVTPDDTVLLALPLFHAYGLNSGLGAVVHHGATGVLVERFDPAETLAVLARHQVSVVVGVPSMFLAWSLLPELGESMESVRIAVCGAAPLEPATAARFTEATRHPVFVGYGLTETAPVLASTLTSPYAKPGSIGQPLPGVQVRLVAAGGEELWRSGTTPPELLDDPDELDLDLESPGTDPGEVVVRGANLFSGYWPDGRGGPDADGWWATGDVAYADADGDLFLVDRLGELILVNGFNVYPREVELALEAHPGVAESAVLGVPHPYTGQTVKAYVVRAPGATVGSEELIEHCERNLARFKCPTAVEFVAELPHSAIGKVRKTLLRSAASDAPVASDAR